MIAKYCRLDSELKLLRNIVSGRENATRNKASFIMELEPSLDSFMGIE